jgi:hypothetical protein
MTFVIAYPPARTITHLKVEISNPTICSLVNLDFLILSPRRAVPERRHHVVGDLRRRLRLRLPVLALPVAQPEYAGLGIGRVVCPMREPFFRQC